VRSFPVWCLALFVSLSCSRFSRDGGQTYIGKVNEIPVSFSEFKMHFEQLKAEYDDISLKNKRLLNQLRLRALNEAIIMTIVRSEANKQKIKVAKEAVESRLANWRDGYPPGWIRGDAQKPEYFGALFAAKDRGQTLG